MVTEPAKDGMKLNQLLKVAQESLVLISEFLNSTKEALTIQIKRDSQQVVWKRWLQLKKILLNSNLVFRDQEEMLNSLKKNLRVLQVEAEEAKSDQEDSEAIPPIVMENSVQLLKAVKIR